MAVDPFTPTPINPSQPQPPRPLGTPEPKAKKNNKANSTATTTRRDKRPEGTSPDAKESVLYLQIQKPSDFKFKAGQFLYLNCPTISEYEWHPFTITSAPQDSFLSVHIRQAGDWTSAMIDTYGRYDKRNNPIYNTLANRHNVTDNKKSPFSPLVRKTHTTESDLGHADLPLPHNLPTATPVVNREMNSHQSPQNEKEVWNPGIPPLIAVDGPFGAPSELYSHFRVAVFIGAGIGVTPFASILRYRMHIHKEEEAQRQKRPQTTNEKEEKHKII